MIYATEAELAAHIGSGYPMPLPADAARLLERASELMDESTLNRAAGYWLAPLPKQVALVLSLAADNILDTAAPHELIAGDVVYFLSVTPGSGIVVGKPYYVIAANLSSTSFQVAEYAAGPAVDLTDDIAVGSVAVKDNQQASLSKAVCAQVEFWLEIGEEFDTVGPQGGLTLGSMRIDKMPMKLSPRARRALFTSGLLYAGVAAVDDTWGL